MEPENNPRTFYLRYVESNDPRIPSFYLVIMDQCPVGAPILDQREACAIVDWCKTCNDFEEEYEESRKPYDDLN